MPTTPRLDGPVIHIYQRNNDPNAREHREGLYYCGARSTNGYWADDTADGGIGREAQEALGIPYRSAPGSASCPLCVSIFRTHGSLSQRYVNGRTPEPCPF